MVVSENEIGLREGRAKFGDLVNRAEYAGEITYITRHGRRVAAIVPINLIPQEQAMTVALYETNSDILVIARGDNAWTLHSGTDLLGQFAAHAAAWINGDWEPNEDDGQTRADLDDLKEVATWSQEDGLSLKVRRDTLGGAARDYIGSTVTLISATSGDSMPEGAKELAESDIDWDDLPEDAQAWATEQGYGDEDELLYIVPGEVHIDGWPTRTVHL